MREQELARLLQSHKTELLKLLSFSGYRSWEDWELACREIHTRQYLGYEKALNLFWTEVYVSGLHSKITKQWYNKYGKNIGVDLMEADLEAAYLMRGVLRGFQPDTGKLENYARTVLFRGLRNWGNQVMSPVNRPDKLLRDNPVSSEQISEETDEDQ